MGVKNRTVDTWCHLLRVFVLFAWTVALSIGVDTYLQHEVVPVRAPTASLVHDTVVVWVVATMMMQATTNNSLVLPHHRPWGLEKP